MEALEVQRAAEVLEQQQSAQRIRLVHVRHVGADSSSSCDTLR